MKEIISGSKRFLKNQSILWVEVPLYDELEPSKVIKKLKLKDDKQKWKEIINYCPELGKYENPKDREFFYNILNTIKPNIVEKIVYYAKIAREKKTTIENEIKVIPELRDIFTEKYSLIG